MNPEKALDILMKDADEAEIFFSKGTTNKIEIKKKDLDVFETSSFQGYGIRIIKDKRAGFSFSNTLNKEVLHKVFKVARIGEKDEALSLPERQRYRKVKGYDERIAGLDPEDATELIEVLIEPCERYHVFPTTGAIYWSVSSINLWNSNGIEARDRETFCSGFLKTVARGSDVSTGTYYEASRSLDLDFSSIGREAARLARDSLNAKEVGSLTTNLVLRPHAVTDLFEYALIPSFSADNIQRNRSVLVGKLEERVFSERLNVVDDGTLKNGLATAKFDGEGVRSQRTELIKRGVLKGYLYDTYTANKSKTNSTGNAERESYSTLPKIGPSNFVISGEGRASEEGMVVHGLIGAHTSNPTSGDFSLETRNAFLNGIPVKKAIISGNIFQLLKRIEGFGKDYKQVSSVRTPTIEFSDVKVVG